MHDAQGSYHANAHRAEAITVVMPDGSSRSLAEVLTDLDGGAAGGLTGGPKDIVSFGPSGKPEAGLFQAQHWSDPPVEPDAPQTSGTWLAAYQKNLPRQMHYVPASQETQVGGVVVRTSSADIIVKSGRPTMPNYAVSRAFTEDAVKTVADEVAALRTALAAAVARIETLEAAAA